MNPYHIIDIEQQLAQSALSSFEQKIKELIENHGLIKARESFFDLMSEFLPQLNQLQALEKQRIFDYLFYLAETAYDIGILSMYSLQCELRPEHIFYWIRHFQGLLNAQEQTADIKAEHDFLELVLAYVQRQLNQSVGDINALVEKVLGQLSHLDGVFLVFLGRLIFDLGLIQQTIVIAQALILSDDDWLKSWGHCQYLNYYLIKGDFVKAQQHAILVSEQERKQDFELNHIWTYLNMLSKLQRGEHYDQALKLQVLENMRSLGDQTLTFTTLIAQIRAAIVEGEYQNAEEMVSWAKKQAFNHQNIPLRLWIEFKLCTIELSLHTQADHQSEGIDEAQRGLLYGKCIRLLKKTNRYHIQEVKERIYQLLFDLSIHTNQKRKWAIKAMLTTDHPLIKAMSMSQLSMLTQSFKKQKYYFQQGVKIFKNQQLYLDLAHHCYDYILFKIDQIDEYQASEPKYIPSLFKEIQSLIKKALFYYSKDLQVHLLDEKHFQPIFINMSFDRVAFEKHFYKNLILIKDRIKHLVYLYFLCAKELNQPEEQFFSFYLRQQKFIFESSLESIQKKTDSVSLEMSYIRHLIKYQIKQELNNQKIIKANQKEKLLWQFQKQLSVSELFISFQLPEIMVSIENEKIEELTAQEYELLIFKLSASTLELVERKLTLDQLKLLQKIPEWMSDTTLSGLEKYQKLMLFFEELKPILFDGIFDDIPQDINRLYLELTALKAIPFELFFDVKTGISLFDRFEIYHLHGIALTPISIKTPQSIALLRGFDRYIHLKAADQEYEQLRGLAKENAVNLVDLEQDDEKKVDLIHYMGHAFIENSPSIFAQKSVFIELFKNHHIERIELSTLLYAQKIKANILCFSACHTTKAEQGLNIDDLLSALLIQETQALICAQWPLPDQSTVILMKGFYEGLFRGESMGVALRKSAIALRRQNPSPLAWCNFRIYVRGLLDSSSP